MQEFAQDVEKNQITTQRKSRFELDFHSLIVSLSGNSRLINIYRNLSNQMLLFFSIDLETMIQEQ